MYLVIYVAGSILVGMIIGGVAGRFAIPVGMFILLLGAGPMAALFLYSEFVGFTRDSSSEGMLSTLIFIMVVPAALTTIVAGFFRGGR